MRYLENAPPDLDAPYAESMHNMLTLSMWLSVVIGAVLFIAGQHGKILWMKTWSIGLILCSITYLIGDALQLIWQFIDSPYSVQPAHQRLLAWTIHEITGTPRRDFSSQPFPVANRSPDWASSTVCLGQNTGCT